MFLHEVSRLSILQATEQEALLHVFSYLGPSSPPSSLIVL